MFQKIEKIQKMVDYLLGYFTESGIGQPQPRPSETQSSERYLSLGENILKSQDGVLSRRYCMTNEPFTTTLTSNNSLSCCTNILIPAGWRVRCGKLIYYPRTNPNPRASQARSIPSILPSHRFAAIREYHPCFLWGRFRPHHRYR